LALSVAALPLAVGSAAEAEEWSFLGARYQAMGGAGVGFVNDSNAPYWNPGALAFAQAHDYDVAVPVGVQAAVEDDVLKTADRIVNLLEADDNRLLDLIEDIGTGDQTNLQGSDLEDLLRLAAREFPKLAQEGDGFVGNANLGLTVRYERFAFTGLGMSYFGVDPILDIVNLRLSEDIAGDAEEQIAGLFPAIGPDPAGSHPLSTSGTALANDIAAVFDAVNGDPALSQAQAEELVFRAEQAGVDTSAPLPATLLGNVASAASNAADGIGNLEENESGAIVRGVIAQQVGISYAHPLPIPLPFLNNTIGIGANLKVMRGTTYFQHITYDSIDDLVDEITDRDNIENSFDWGLDLGLMYKPLDWFSAGIVARNVNTPSFETEGPGDYELEPQVRAGVAFRPFSNWTLAADVDLTENQSSALQGYNSRLLSVGTEVGIPFWIMGIALRAGFYTNLGQDADHAIAPTAGLGIKIWHFQLDLAAGISPEFQEIEAAGGDDFPTRVNVSAALKFKKTF
jgi:hypothetical protein